MPYRHISNDYKLRTIVLLDQNVPRAFVSDVFAVSERSTYRWQKNVREGGVVYPTLPATRGRPSILSPEIRDVIFAIIEDDPTAYLDEISDWLHLVYDISVPLSTLSSNLIRHFSKLPEKITSHFQSASLRSGHGSQSPFSYAIAIAFLTIIVGVGHLSTLVLDLDAATSGVRFRRQFAESQSVLTTLLVFFWIGVVFVVGLKQGMGTIGGCPYVPPAGYVSQPQICMEWFIVLGFTCGTTLVLPAMYYANTKLQARDAFVSRVWQWRQYRANKAKGQAPPPRKPVRGRAAQLPPAAPPPPFGSAFQMMTIPATGQQLQSSAVPPSGAAPPTYLDVEAMGGQANDSRRESSSDSMTSPAAPPPSTLPSWMQPSTPVVPEHRPLL
ncbi:hypothetical protein M407DRAFT_18119 [Tulasnella calospora MUT 4182]|uniref:Uncharacterized protein n=1 Tax=Tulasnella calospora MUT 4182 TaxID=1051891 RepID=A0A0C3LG67_9AGAM|nr:hypothetical protein M407DRAFT_18119 [Tulasnella calospora MUT 4182]